MVLVYADDRGRSDKFEPFEPLNGSQRIPGRRPGLRRVEGRDLGQGTHLIFRVSDADTDCDRRCIFVFGAFVFVLARLPERQANG